MEQNMKIKFSYTNVYGETYTTEREVSEDFLEMDELEILNDTYKNFLRNATFRIDDEDEIVVLRENEYIETYCDEDDYCDGDCENCDIDD
jgi:hypothetical protein